jgi:ATP-dependent exoDNAse (exonuclease V) alpha subunit
MRAGQSLVTRNNTALDLFNGDVGIVVPKDGNHPQSVAFPQATGEPRRLSIS